MVPSPVMANQGPTTDATAYVTNILVNAGEPCEVEADKGGTVTGLGPQIRYAYSLPGKSSPGKYGPVAEDGAVTVSFTLDPGESHTIVAESSIENNLLSIDQAYAKATAQVTCAGDPPYKIIESTQDSTNQTATSGALLVQCLQGSILQLGSDEGPAASSEMIGCVSG